MSDLSELNNHSTFELNNGELEFDGHSYSPKKYDNIVMMGGLVLSQYYKYVLDAEVEKEYDTIYNC